MSKIEKLLFFIVVAIFAFSTANAYRPQYLDEDKKIKIHWKQKQVNIYLSKSFFKETNNIKNKANVLRSIETSLEKWEKVAKVKFNLKLSDKKSVSKKGNAGDGVSLITIAQTAENLLLFGENLDKTSAITRLFYDKTGRIKEADIVLNPILLFSSDGTFGSYDLESTITHEIGHFIGLGHSKILGSTMHSHQGKNGIFNLPVFHSRSLSLDDAAGAISLFGKRENNINCCTKLAGRLDVTNKSKIDNLQIWIEDYLTGQVVAGTVADKKGNYSIEGIPKAVYRVFAKDLNGKYGIKKLGLVDLTSKTSKFLNKSLYFNSKDFTLTYLGLNGQLSNTAVPLSSGMNYRFYFAGNDLDLDEFYFGIRSNNFIVAKDSLLKHNYGVGITVYSFEAHIKNSTPSGVYSFYLKKKNKLESQIVGGITVE